MTKLKKIQDEDYEIVDNGEDQFHQIHLKATSPYSDVIFQFGEVKLLEENDHLRVKFEYEVFQNPKRFNTNSEQFREYIGHILMTNLEEILLYNKYAKGSKDNGV